MEVDWRAELRAIIDEVEAGEMPDLIGELARAQALLQLRLHARGEKGTRPSPAPLRSLTAEEVSQELGTSRKWVYEHQGELGAVRLSRGALRFPEQAIRRYMAARRC